MSVLGGSDPTARETHSGTTTEIDSAGDYVIDTTEALGGDVVFRLAAGRAFSIEIGATQVTCPECSSTSNPAHTSS